RVLETLGVDEDALLGLQGIGPKALDELRKILTAFPYPEVEAPPEPVVEGEEATLEVEISEAEAEAVEGLAPDAEPIAVGEADIELAAVEPGAAPSPEGETPEAAEAPEESFEELIEQFTEVIAPADFEEEDEKSLESIESRKRKKGEARVVEYDPDLDEMVVHRRRKREEGDDWTLGNF
ncbi:MAG: hypothetical protein MUP44_11825, partial [Anaerolineales bacterium]|nr:hypothetical protein [Anaerolineales bacterium]